MKGLRIVLGLVAMGLLWLSLPASAQLASDAPMAVEPKAMQGDTIRMLWVPNTSSAIERKSFSFRGEKGATYKVEWGDGNTSIVTGKGPDSSVTCVHTYSYHREASYKVKLYGVATAQKKKK